MTCSHDDDESGGGGGGGASLPVVCEISCCEVLAVVAGFLAPRRFRHVPFCVIALELAWISGSHRSPFASRSGVEASSSLLVEAPDGVPDDEGSDDGKGGGGGGGT
jgi:hypothetical protein